MERIKRSWALTKASLEVLGKDKELMIFPILSSIALLMVTATFLFPMLVGSLLDNVVEKVFKPCVKQAGFELFRLDEVPRAGLIDDQLRVAIQNSDFLIADPTHDNLGSYWEAGYAEGLGKPVIYTCEKEKFEKEKTHFDTNHHLTIIWDKNNPDTAGERLKATIRATLPHLAVQENG